MKLLFKKYFIFLLIIYITSEPQVIRDRENRILTFNKESSDILEFTLTYSTTGCMFIKPYARTKPGEVKEEDGLSIIFTDDISKDVVTLPLYESVYLPPGEMPKLLKQKASEATCKKLNYVVPHSVETIDNKIRIKRKIQVDKLQLEYTKEYSGRANDDFAKITQKGSLDAHYSLLKDERQEEFKISLHVEYGSTQNKLFYIPEEEYTILNDYLLSEPVIAEEKYVRWNFPIKNEKASSESPDKAEVSSDGAEGPPHKEDVSLNKADVSLSEAEVFLNKPAEVTKGKDNSVEVGEVKQVGGKGADEPVTDNLNNVLGNNNVPGVKQEAKSINGYEAHVEQVGQSLSTEGHDSKTAEKDINVAEPEKEKPSKGKHIYMINNWSRLAKYKENQLTPYQGIKRTFGKEEEHPTTAPEEDETEKDTAKVDQLEQEQERKSLQNSQQAQNTINTVADENTREERGKLRWQELLMKKLDKISRGRNGSKRKLKSEKGPLGNDGVKEYKEKGIINYLSKKWRVNEGYDRA
jgi:hypothetical protein